MKAINKIATTITAIVVAVSPYSVYAATSQFITNGDLVSQHKSVEVPIDVAVPRQFTVRLPSNINMEKDGGSNKCVYNSTIGVKGDVEVGSYVSVLPNNSFMLYDVSKRPVGITDIPISEAEQTYTHKAPEVVNVDQKESMWSQEELATIVKKEGSNYIYDVNTGYHNVEINLETDNIISAGKWQGKLNFEISYKDSSSFTIYSDLAQLKASDLPINTFVRTQGYYGAGDGGGAKYRITNTTKPSNGRDIIELNNGSKAELIIENNTIIVEQYGAKGDGIIDDVGAIQAALDSGHNVSFTQGKQLSFSI